MTSSPSKTLKIAAVAVFAPLPQLFDYQWQNDMPAIGARVKVPFGRSERVGIVMEHKADCDTPAEKMKSITAVLDDKPVLCTAQLKLCIKAAQYYHHPLGEVLAAALPSRLRAGEPAVLPQCAEWRISEQAKASKTIDDFKRAPQQAKVWQRLLAEGSLTEPLQPAERAALQRLVTAGHVDKSSTISLPKVNTAVEPVQLNKAQQQSLLELQQCLLVEQPVSSQSSGSRFATCLLNGVTGSGKTELYLALMAEVLAAGLQTLLLVPEINLTPQLLDRIQRRLSARIVVLHSGLNDKERADAWLLAQQGLIDVVIGTRSAVFTPLAKPGLIVVDEEHDTSFKQQDGFRYSARDLAVMRAQFDQHPVLLGSATPALETLHNVQQGRYQQVLLQERNNASPPSKCRLIDLRVESTTEGLTASALGTLDAHLQAGQQVLVFLNRRGYAPLLLCNACGWQADCPHCSAHLTLHQRRRRLTCHHCGFETGIPEQCPDCASIDLGDVGQGTERLEAVLREKFPSYGLVRIDSDTTSSKSGLANARQQVLSGEAKILVGTQLLAKGHHFPELTCVVMVDVDGMLCSPDPRAAEQTAQMIIQVAGRAGRGEQGGEVLIQTRYAHHPLLTTLLRQGYAGFAEKELAERQAAQMLPFHKMALLRAEAQDKSLVQSFLQESLQLGGHFTGVQLLGPATAVMERRAGRYRMQLMLNAASRSDLQNMLLAWLPAVRKLPSSRKVRWSIDIDPVDFH